MSRHGRVFGGVVFPDSEVVCAESDVQDPMQLVSDGPMETYRVQQSLGIALRTGDQVTLFHHRLGIDPCFCLEHANGLGAFGSSNRVWSVSSRRGWFSLAGKMCSARSSIIVYTGSTWQWIAFSVRIRSPSRGSSKLKNHLVRHIMWYSHDCPSRLLKLLEGDWELSGALVRAILPKWWQGCDHASHEQNERRREDGHGAS